MKLKQFITLILLLTSLGVHAQKKVAVVTFYVNRHIGTDQLGDLASLGTSVKTLSKDPEFDLQSVLNNFHDVFFNEYAESFPFELLPENEVIENEDYKAFVSKGKETEDGKEDPLFKNLFQNYVVYPGYKPMAEYFLSGKNRNELRMLEIFGDKVDGVMFVYLDFAFAQRTAGLAAGIQSYARIKLWNKEGKKVFKINEFAKSKKTVPLLAGIPIMKTEKILPMCEDASKSLFADLGKRIKKISSKADKKL